MTYEACKEAAEIAHEKTATLRRVMQAKDSLHPETRQLVNDFAKALAEKLAKAEQKYGYRDDWRTANWEAECRAELIRHINKGDPLDVAAYCAFMWRRGWSTDREPRRSGASLSEELEAQIEQTQKLLKAAPL